MWPALGNPNFYNTLISWRNISWWCLFSLHVCMIIEKSNISCSRHTNFLRKPLSQHSIVQYNTTLRNRLNLAPGRNILVLLNAVINNSVLLFICLKGSFLSHKRLPVEQDEVTYYYLLFHFTAHLSITIHFHLQIVCVVNTTKFVITSKTLINALGSVGVDNWLRFGLSVAWVWLINVYAGISYYLNTLWFSL